jgi:hypothetical protein
MDFSNAVTGQVDAALESGMDDVVVYAWRLDLGVN